MQLKFKCPDCGAAGLTPDLAENKAIAVALGELRLRCPHCSGIIETAETAAEVLARSKLSAATAARESVSEVVRQALRAELERRAERK